MRDIKFRAWDKENKNFPLILCLADAFKEYEENPDRYNLLQYTWLKDKNGVEIYEGDVVKKESCGKYWIWIVKFYWSPHSKYGLENIEHNCHWAFCEDWCNEKHKLNHIDNMPFNNKWEVIWNIYENPNLLKNE